MGALGTIAAVQRLDHPPVPRSSRIAAPLFATGQDMSLRPDRWHRRRPGRRSQTGKPSAGHRRHSRQRNARSARGRLRGRTRQQPARCRAGPRPGHDSDRLTAAQVAPSGAGFGPSSHRTPTTGPKGASARPTRGGSSRMTGPAKSRRPVAASTVAGPGSGPQNPLSGPPATADADAPRPRFWLALCCSHEKRGVGHAGGVWAEPLD